MLLPAGAAAVLTLAMPCKLGRVAVSGHAILFALHP